MTEGHGGNSAAECVSPPTMSRPRSFVFGGVALEDESGLKGYFAKLGENELNAQNAIKEMVTLHTNPGAKAELEDPFAVLVERHQSLMSVYGALAFASGLVAVVVGVLAMYSSLVTMLVVGGNVMTELGVSATWSPVWQSNSSELSAVGLGVVVLGLLRNRKDVTFIGVTFVAMGLATQIYAMVAAGDPGSLAGSLFVVGVHDGFNVSSLNAGGVDEGVYLGGPYTLLWLSVLTGIFVVLVIGGMGVYAVSRMSNPAYGDASTMKNVQVYPFAPNGLTALHEPYFTGDLCSEAASTTSATVFAVLCVVMVLVDWCVSIAAMTRADPRAPSGWDLMDSPRFGMLVAVGMTVIAPSPRVWGIFLPTAVSSGNTVDEGRVPEQLKQMYKTTNGVGGGVRRFQKRHCRGRPMVHASIAFLAVFGTVAAWTHYVALVRNLTTDNGVEYVYWLQQTPELGTSFSPPSGGCYLNADCYTYLPWFRHGGAKVGPRAPRRSTFGAVTTAHHVLQLLVLLFGTASLVSRLLVWSAWGVQVCVRSASRDEEDDSPGATCRDIGRWVFGRPRGVVVVVPADASGGKPEESSKDR